MTRKQKCECGCEMFKVEQLYNLYVDLEDEKINKRTMRYRYYCSHCGKQHYKSDMIDAETKRKMR